jgi:NAD(P)-dependent dehydrogenase (short-subunit alcohol dehydrogenase family)
MGRHPLNDNFGLFEGADMKLVATLFPLAKTAKPEEIATATAHLASSEACFVTGIGFPFDGGQTTG